MEEPTAKYRLWGGYGMDSNLLLFNPLQLLLRVLDLRHAGEGAGFQILQLFIFFRLLDLLPRPLLPLAIRLRIGLQQVGVVVVGDLLVELLPGAREALRRRVGLDDVLVVRRPALPRLRALPARPDARS